MDLNEFRLSRLCKPLVLPDEEQPQDAREWRRLVLEDQERQYQEHLNRNGTAESGSHSDEEKRVADRLEQLTKKTLSGGVESRHTDKAALNLTLPDELREAGVVHSGSSAPPAQTPQQRWRAKNKERLRVKHREYMRDYRKKHD